MQFTLIILHTNLRNQIKNHLIQIHDLNYNIMKYLLKYSIIILTL